MGRPLSESVARAVSPIIWTILAQPELDQRGNMVQTRLLQTLADQIREGGLANRPKMILIRLLIILTLVSGLGIPKISKLMSPSSKKSLNISALSEYSLLCQPVLPL